MDVISTIATPKNLRIVSFAAGAAAIAGAAVYMTASAAGYTFNFGGPKGSNVPAASTEADQSTAPSSSGCNEVVTHFSSDLGRSADEVDSAVHHARGHRDAVPQQAPRQPEALPRHDGHQQADHQRAGAEDPAAAADRADRVLGQAHAQADSGGVAGRLAGAAAPAPPSCFVYKRAS